MVGDLIWLVGIVVGAVVLTYPVWRIGNED